MMYRVTWSVKKGKRGLRYYANFRSYVTTDKEKLEADSEKADGTLDVRAVLPNPTELIAIARMLGCRVSDKRGWIATEDDGAYFRLVVYAVVRQTLRDQRKIEHLKRLVLDESFGVDAWWWANTFINRYQSDGMKRGVGIKALYRLAKAFKIVYGLEG